MSLLRFIARTLFATIFLVSGYDALATPGGRVTAVSESLPLPQPEFLVRLNGGGMLVGGAALAVGLKPRVAALSLAAALVPTTYVGHRFWKQSDPGVRGNQKVHFNKNVSLIGGLLTYSLTEDG
jgi:putative oxidoreductase